MKAIFAALAFASVSMTSAQGADFPESGKPITLIVPYAAGGGVDFVARTTAAALEKELGTQVQVENKPGAGAQVGLTELVRADPDGYTLAMLVMPTVLSHYLDPARGAIYTRDSFQPISHLYSVSYAMSVPTESRFKDFTSFIEEAKAKPGTVKLADAGLMTAPHVFMGLVEKVTGAKFAPVHFDGGAPAMAALLGQHVEGMSGGGSDFVPQIASGKIRILAVSTEGEDPLMPGIASMKSLGYDITFATATGIVAPAKTPADVVSALDGALKKVSDSQEYKDKLLGNGITPKYMNSADYSAFWVKYDETVGPVIQDLLKEKQ